MVFHFVKHVVLYCSFPYGLYQEYHRQSEFIAALLEDIDDVRQICETYNLHTNTLYMGGGTPTILNNEDFSSCPNWIIYIDT